MISIDINKPMTNVYIKGRRDDEGNVLGDAKQFMLDLREIMDKNNIEEIGCYKCDVEDKEGWNGCCGIQEPRP